MFRIYLFRTGVLERVAGVLLFLVAGARVFFVTVSCCLNYDYSQTLFGLSDLPKLFFSEFVRSRCLFLYPTKLLYNIQDPQRVILIFEFIKKGRG